MIRRTFQWFVCFALFIGARHLSPAVEFSSDIAPILVSECLVCHSPEKAKGGYRVHTFSALFKTGKSDKPAITPGKPDESELFKRLITHDEDDRMPQDDEPLTPKQIDLFRDWITAGALFDRSDTNQPITLLIPQAAHPEPPKVYRRPLPILALAFTPEANELAVSGYHEVTFWDLEGKLVNRVTNAPARIRAIAFQPAAPSGTRRFAIAGGTPGRAGELSIYENGVLLTNLARAADEFLTTTFSTDGKYLAAGGADNAIRVYQTENWAPLSTIQQHADWVTSVSFNSDASKIISASRDRTARIYDAESGELETTYTSHTSALFAAIFLPDGKAASGGNGKSVHIWETKEAKKQKELNEAQGAIHAMLAAPDSFFVASADKNIRQYSARDFKLLRTFSGHQDLIFSLAYDPANERLASGSYGGQIIVWNCKDGTQQSQFIAAPLEGKVASSK